MTHSVAGLGVELLQLGPGRGDLRSLDRVWGLRRPLGIPPRPDHLGGERQGLVGLFESGAKSPVMPIIVTGDTS